MKCLHKNQIYELMKTKFMNFMNTGLMGFPPSMQACMSAALSVKKQRLLLGFVLGMGCSFSARLQI